MKGKEKGKQKGTYASEPVAMPTATVVTSDLAL